METASCNVNVEARIDVGRHSMHGLAMDPWSDDVWVVLQDRFVQINQELEIERQFWPILDFDEQTARPAMLVEESPLRLHSNALALIARSLGESHYRSFYDASIDWPDLRDSDIMYNFAMNGPSWTSMPMLPKQLNVLIENAKPTGSWRRFVCLLDDERAKKLCTLDLENWPSPQK